MAANPKDKSKTIHIVDDHEVTSLEKITRLIFGGVFGAGVGGFFIYKYDLSVLSATVVSFLAVCTCALLSLIYGDRFWLFLFSDK